jgi:hypothetical protein
MRHPSEGLLRRLLDEPPAVPDADRQHVAVCPTCLDTLADMKQDATLVATALAVGAVTDVVVDAAWRRLPVATGSAEPRRSPAPAGAVRPRSRLRRPVIAIVTVAAVLGGASAAAANDWLPIFRTQEVAPLSLSAADLNALPDLGRYGYLSVASAPEMHEVADADAASAETGIDVPEVSTLPRGVSGTPVYQVGSEITATFTFSMTAAARAAADAGKPVPTPPAGLDGTQVRLVAGPGVAQVWSQSSGIPSLIVARAVAPTAYSTGVPFDVLRDYLLSMPGIPDNVATQLRALNADGSTLPIPVPEDRVTTSSTEVNGVPATVISARDRTMAAVVWVRDGVLTAVGGALDVDEVIEIAGALH